MRPTESTIMAKSSIHFSIVKPGSEAHNLRKVPLDYTFPELSKNNESAMSSSIEAMDKECRGFCKQVTGRKMQKNAAPIREAVVNLNPHHNLKDLNRVSRALMVSYGITCFQIHIHRDEGKSPTELNHHAHMLFRFQDMATGKTVKFSKTDLSRIQTLVARSLDMERGELRVNSNRERLEPIEFKRVQREKEIKALELQIGQLEQKKKELGEIRNELREGVDRNKAREIAERLEDYSERDLRAVDKKTIRRAVEFRKQRNQALRAEIEAVEEKSTEYSNALYRLTEIYKKYEGLS